jgi:serine/threonine protein kinase
MHIGTIVDGRFEIVESLGRGSFAHTFMALERETNRRVAIKVLHPPSIESWKSYELFAREAQVLGALRHHGVPAVYESFRAKLDGVDTAFLVLEFIPGPTLDHLIAGGKSCSTEEVRDLILRLMDILIYLHERVPPILHRDIKPANIILRDERMPVLVDFGSVRNVFRSPDDDGSTVAGTYGYMPYEQYMGHASPASDLYALGATLLHLLTRRPPSDFLSEDGRIEVPDDLPTTTRIKTILRRLLAPAVTERFQSAAELRAALLRESSSSTTMVPARSSGMPIPAAVANVLADLPPGPRDLSRATADRFHKVAYSTLQLIVGSARPGALNVGTALLIGVLSVFTAGILPLTFFGIARRRRKRLRRFFRDGVATTAVVSSMAKEEMAFDEKWLGVQYEFDVDGETHRGSDQVLPSTANLWREGDTIAILYLPGDDYDSVIVSAG